MFILPPNLEKVGGDREFSIKMVDVQIPTSLKPYKITVCRLINGFKPKPNIMTVDTRTLGEYNAS